MYRQLYYKINSYPQWLFSAMLLSRWLEKRTNNNQHTQTGEKSRRPSKPSIYYSSIYICQNLRNIYSREAKIENRTPDPARAVCLFYQQHSTVLQLIKLMDQLQISKRQKSHTGHFPWRGEGLRQGLVRRSSPLLQIGTPMHLLKLIDSFLLNICFNVRVEDAVSNNRQIRVCVPQCSCFSSHLYLIYTNDIPLTGGSHLYLFADDTMFHSSNHNPRYAIATL